IGVTVSAWIEEGIGSVDYLRIIAASMRTIANGRRIGIVLMPANMPIRSNESSDYDASLQLLEELRSCCPVEILAKEVVSAQLFKALAKQMDVFISTRMHAAILATMAGTPTITINTQRKLRGYMAVIQQSRYSLDVAQLNEQQLIRA